MITKDLPRGATKFQRVNSFTTALTYGREGGDDLGQRQSQFLLELSSVLQDRVPSPGIAFARMIQSNDTISDMIFSFLLLTVSAPPERGAIKKSARRPRLAMYTTCLRRL